MQTSPKRAPRARRRTIGLRTIERLVLSALLLAAAGSLQASGFPPFVQDDAATVTRGGTVSVLTNGSGSVLANDFDFERDPLTATLTRDVRHGTLTLRADGTFSYTHNGNNREKDRFRYRAFDGSRFSREAEVEIEITPGEPIPPVIEGQSEIEIDEDSSREIVLNDLEVFDPDSDFPRDFSLEVRNGANYSRNGAVISPVQDFNGELTVPVRVSDGSNFSNVFNLLVAVRARNDAPFVTGIVGDREAIEDEQFSLPLAGFFADVDDGDSLSFSASGLPPSNSLAIQSSGDLSGTPVRADAREAAYNVEVTATDSAGAAASLTFRLFVFPQDRADLSVTAAVSVNPVTVGESVQWQVNVENKGPADLEQGELTVSWSTSGPPLSLSPPPSCTVQDNDTRAPSLRCALDGMLALDALNFNVQSSQDEDGDSTLIALATADDPIPENNSAIAASQVIAQFSEGPTQILSLPGLGLDSGDLDGDGNVDVVTVADETRVFFNSGNRDLTTPGISLGAETGGTAITLLDWNGDGFSDIAVGGLSGRTAEIFVNDGSGAFQSGVRIQSGGVGEVYSVAAADLDLSGNSELIVAGASGTVILRESMQNGFDQLPLPVGAGIDVAVADIDANGYPDIVVVEAADRAVAVLSNTGDGEVFEMTRLFAGSVANVGAADVNDDGAVDLLLAVDGGDLSPPVNRILVQQASGEFNAGATFGASAVTELLAGDVDIDGWPDIVAVNASGVHQLYRGSASGEFSLDPEQIVSAGMRRGVLIDVNGDQSFDLILAGSEAVEIHANNGIGRLGLGDRVAPELTLIGEPSITIPAGETAYTDSGATAVDDIDGDLTDAIETSGSVNATAPGTYTLTFRVADRAGNSVSAQRTVTVEVNSGAGGGGGGAIGGLPLIGCAVLLGFALWRRRRDPGGG